MNRLPQRRRVHGEEDFSLAGDLPSLKLWQGKEAGKRKVLQPSLLADRDWYANEGVSALSANFLLSAVPAPLNAIAYLTGVSGKQKNLLNSALSACLAIALATAGASAVILEEGGFYA